MKPGNKKMKSVFLRAASVFLFAALCLSFTGCGRIPRIRKNFKQGVALYDEGHLDEAKEKFILAEDYGTAEEFVKNIEECQQLLQQANGFIDEQDYEQAVKILDSLPLYDKAEEKKAFIEGLCTHYVQAVSKFESGEFLESRKEFVLALGYEKSDEYVAEIDRMNSLYEEAKSFMAAENYSDALLKLREIGIDFEDSAELLNECVTALNNKPVKLDAFEHFYNDEYPDGSVAINIGVAEGHFNVSDTQGILFSGVLNENGGIISMTVWINPALAGELGIDDSRKAIAHSIHAMNPYLMDMTELEANLDDYFCGNKIYGSWKTKVKIDSSGEIVLNITFAAQ